VKQLGDKQKLTKDKIKQLKDLFYVWLDDYHVPRRGKLSHFNTKIAYKEWNSFEEAENATCLLATHFIVKNSEKQEKEAYKLAQKIKKSKEAPIKLPEVEPESQFIEVVEQDINKEVKKIQEAKNQLNALEPHLNNVIVGELNNKLAIFVLLTGSKYNDIGKKQFVVIKAESGAGKSTMARMLSRGYKVKEVGRFSAHALDYTNLQEFDVLLLKEIGGMDMEKQGVSTLKFLSADDEGYNVEITVKDKKTDRWTTVSHRIPPITVLSTTTRLHLEPQFERRTWFFGADETEEQTERIAKWKAKRKRQELEVTLGRRTITEYDFSKEVIRRFVEQFKPVCNIVIPFPETLNSVFGFKQLRIRGDIDKVSTFVELYAGLNWKRLDMVKEDVYAVTPEVCIEALRIIMKPFANMLSKMDKRTKALLNALKKIELHHQYSEINKFQRDQIARMLGKSHITIKNLLKSLVHAGVMSSDDKKPINFTLLYDVKEIEEKLDELSLKPETFDVLIRKMRKEAQTLLETQSKTKTTGNAETSVSLTEAIVDNDLTDSKVASTEKPVKNQTKQKSLKNSPETEEFNFEEEPA